MKNTLKIISTLSIILFAILYGLDKFNVEVSFNSGDLRNFFVLIYLFTSLKYYQLVLKEKNQVIDELKKAIENN